MTSLDSSLPWSVLFFRLQKCSELPASLLLGCPLTVLPTWSCLLIPWRRLGLQSRRSSLISSQSSPFGDYTSRLSPWPQSLCTEWDLYARLQTQLFSHYYKSQVNNRPTETRLKSSRAHFFHLNRPPCSLSQGTDCSTTSSGLIMPSFCLLPIWS